MASIPDVQSLIVLIRYMIRFKYEIQLIIRMS